MRACKCVRVHGQRSRPSYTWKKHFGGLCALCYLQTLPPPPNRRADGAGTSLTSARDSRRLSWPCRRGSSVCPAGAHLSPGFRETELKAHRCGIKGNNSHVPGAWPAGMGHHPTLTHSLHIPRHFRDS